MDMTSNSSDILVARGLTSAHGATTVFAGIDLVIRAGESVAVVGPSGSGKTTLLHALSGLRPPVSGTVHFADSRAGAWCEVTAMNAEEHTALRRTGFGMVFQSGHSPMSRPVRATPGRRRESSTSCSARRALPGPRRSW